MNETECCMTSTEQACWTLCQDTETPPGRGTQLLPAQPAFSSLLNLSGLWKSIFSPNCWLSLTTSDVESINTFFILIR